MFEVFRKIFSLTSKLTRRIERELYIFRLSRELSNLEKESEKVLTRLGEICYDLRLAGLIDADLSSDSQVIDLVNRRDKIRDRITLIQQRIAESKKVTL